MDRDYRYTRHVAVCIDLITSHNTPDNRSQSHCHSVSLFLHLTGKAVRELYSNLQLTKKCRD